MSVTFLPPRYIVFRQHEIELTANAIPRMWTKQSGGLVTSTLQLIDITLEKQGCYKITVSDGNFLVVLFSNKKPAVTALIEEQKQTIINALVSVETASTPHPRSKSGAMLFFIQTLVVLQRGGTKRGAPVKYTGPQGVFGE